MFFSTFEQMSATFLIGKDNDIVIHHVNDSSVHKILALLHVRTTATTFFNLTSLTNVFTIAG